MRTNLFKILLTLVGVLAVSALAQAGVINPQDLAFLGMAGVLTNAGARVIDPILTTVVQGYKNADLVGHNLFPAVPVQVSGGQILEFGRESFRLYNSKRAPGGATKRLQFGYLGKPFALLNDALEAVVPREQMRDASRVPGIDLGSRAVNLTMKAMQLALENDQAALATNAANYDGNHKVTLAGATKWSAATGDPHADVDAAREAVRASTGIYPNVLMLSALAFKACRNNPNVKANFQYTTHESITEAMLANYFSVEKVVVGKAITFSDANVATDVWGNNAVLAYVPSSPSGMEEPSFGYTYTMEANPAVEPAYYDNNAKSWIYGVNYERAPVLSGISSGYLIINPN